MPDGTLIQWANISGTVNIQNAWGNLYETSSGYSFGDWPVPFVSKPSVAITSIAGTPVFAEALSNVSETYIGSAYLWSATKRTNTNFTFAVIGIGRWK